MGQNAGGMAMVARLLKFLLVIIILAALAVIGYAYLGDLSPQQQELKEQVTIEVD